MAVEAKPLYEAEAKKRQVELAGTRSNPRQVPEKVPEAPHVQPKPKPRTDNESRTQAAKDFGTNKRYVNQAQKVKEQAPDVFEKLKRGKVTIQEREKKKAGFEEGNPGDKKHWDNARGQNDRAAKKSETAKKIAEQVGKSEKTVRRYDKEVEAVEKANNTTTFQPLHMTQFNDYCIDKQCICLYS